MQRGRLNVTPVDIVLASSSVLAAVQMHVFTSQLGRVGCCPVPYHACDVLRSIMWTTTPRGHDIICCYLPQLNNGWFCKQVWGKKDRISWKLQIQLESLPGRNVRLRKLAHRCKLTEKAQHVGWSSLFSCCRRALQERFAAERDWEKYHTPRNLMLAMVCMYDYFRNYTPLPSHACWVSFFR